MKKIDKIAFLSFPLLGSAGRGSGEKKCEVQKFSPEYFRHPEQSESKYRRIGGIHVKYYGRKSHNFGKKTGDCRSESG